MGWLNTLAEICVQIHTSNIHQTYFCMGWLHTLVEITCAHTHIVYALILFAQVAAWAGYKLVEITCAHTHIVYKLILFAQVAAWAG
jgi:hypothetical protein